MLKPADLVSDPTLLEAALEGLELQRKRIDEQIRQVRSMLTKRKGVPAPEGVNLARAKRDLSAAGRKRIAAAQRKRWAEYRKASATK